MGAFDAACGIKVVRNMLTVSRFAVVVGNKVSKHAVDRNRIRRQYREILRVMLPEIKSGCDVLLLAGKTSLSLDYEEKKSRLRSVLYRAKML